jgi:uncharacterized protein (DUF169 family)
VKIICEEAIDTLREDTGRKDAPKENTVKESTVENPKKLRFCEAVRLAAGGERVVLTGKNLDCFGAEMSLGFVEPLLEGLTKSVVVEPFTQDGEFDVVLVVANPEKIMELSLVYSQLFKERLEARFSGEKAVCGEATAEVIISGRPNISFLCHGARSYARYGSDEVVIGMPSDAFRKICWYLEKKQIRSMCGCLTDDIPQHVVERLERIGFYKATDHFAGMFEGRIVKLHVFRGEETVGLFTSIRFSSEEEAKVVKSEFEDPLSKCEVYIQRRENWLDLSKIIEFELVSGDGEFEKRIREEVSKLLDCSKKIIPVDQKVR